MQIFQVHKMIHMNLLFSSNVNILCMEINFSKTINFRVFNI